MHDMAAQLTKTCKYTNLNLLKHSSKHAMGKGTTAKTTGVPEKHGNQLRIRVQRIPATEDEIVIKDLPSFQPQGAASLV